MFLECVFSRQPTLHCIENAQALCVNIVFTLLHSPLWAFVQQFAVCSAFLWDVVVVVVAVSLFIFLTASMRVTVIMFCNTCMLIRIKSASAGRTLFKKKKKEAHLQKCAQEVTQCC